MNSPNRIEVMNEITSCCTTLCNKQIVLDYILFLENKNMKPITVYTLDNCEFCDTTKKKFIDNKIEFTEQKIGVDVTKDFILDNYPSMKTAPIVVQGDRFGGSSMANEIIQNLYSFGDQRI